MLPEKMEQLAKIFMLIYYFQAWATGEQKDSEMEDATF